MPSAKIARLQDESVTVENEITELRAVEEAEGVDTALVREKLAAAEKRAVEIAEECRIENEREAKLAALRAVRATVASASDPKPAERKAPAIHVIGKVKGFKNTDDAIRGGQFLRALGLGDLAEARAMGETSPTFDGKGSELVSPELYRGFIDVLSYASVGVQVATLFQTDSNTFEIPKIGQIEADWVDELDDVGSEDYATSREVINLYKAGRLVEVSNELLSDSSAVVNLASLFTSRIGLALATKIDDVWLNGDEDKEIDGLVDAVSEGNTVEAGDDDDGIDLAELVGKIDNRASNTAWVVSSEGWTHIMKASVVTQSTTIGDRVLPVVMGSPVYRVLGLPAGTLGLYGDFSMATAVVTHRNGLQVAASEHAGFNRDSVVFRGLQRFGLANHDPQFVAKLVSAS
jgi:HK97 family phage major capsid protein